MDRSLHTYNFGLISGMIQNRQALARGTLLNPVLHLLPEGRRQRI